jgi:hypothetical protein
VDFSGPTIFRHTITHRGSCAAFFYVCSADTDFSEIPALADVFI